MLEGRVIVVTHAKPFVGAATGGVLAGQGATVVSGAKAEASSPRHSQKGACENTAKPNRLLS
jgi:NAD(P)-dependent dehydrogenase (short-subunit alcohol dehydrogenase family)